MISSKNGEVFVYGRRDEVFADLAMLLRGLREGGMAITDDEIAKCVKVSKMTEEEIDAEKERLEKRANELLKELSNLCPGNKPEEKKADDKVPQPDDPSDDFMKKLADIVEKALKEN